jgi:hypothetical protein
MSDSVFSTLVPSRRSNILATLRKQEANRFWDHIDDFQDWRCLDSLYVLQPLLAVVTQAITAAAEGFVLQ